MKLTAEHVFNATPIVVGIINEKRPLPQKGLYRLARIYNALKPEFDAVSERRDALIMPYGYFAPILDTAGQPERNADGSPKLADRQSVPPDKVGEFATAWKEIAEETIEVAVEPIPLAQLDIGDDAPGLVSANELILLGDLVKE